MRAGLVLAGGRSTRFGEGDKALARLDGVPMIRRVADRLTTVIDSLIVNCRPEQTGSLSAALADYPLEVTVAEDAEPDRGPMAGIRTGLQATDADYSVVVACDMPFVDPDFVEYLFERAAGHDAAVPRLGDGWFQTTQAVYRSRPMAEACERALARGEHRIVEPLFDLDYVVVDETAVETHASLETFENVNTQEELEAAEKRLRDGSSCE
jgi:molybdopterin-guanine dinucleotide biosynthesis protein A